MKFVDRLALLDFAERPRGPLAAQRLSSGISQRTTSRYRIRVGLCRPEIRADDRGINRDLPADSSTQFVFLCRNRDCLL
jgi:hypothetical protein